MTEAEIKFERIKEQAKSLKEEFEARKLRGINEFNLFSVLLSESDEVRLHSKFIYSLLNPLEKHYQKYLFLRLFLKVIGLENFINLQNAKVYKEYEFIDIYITDGKKHIILENKIYANDQKEQIKRYIEKIKSKNLFVLYLSLDRESPSEYSLGEYRLNDRKNKILDEKENFIAEFKSIHYDTEIKEWLEMCLNEVGDITNLSLYIRDYSMIIDKIYGNYKELVMETKELWNRENYGVLKAIFENYKNDKFNIVKEFFDEFEKKLKKEKPNYIFYKNNEYDQKQGGFRIKLGEDHKIVYIFEFYKSDYNKVDFGFFAEKCKFNDSAKQKLKKEGFDVEYEESNWAWKEGEEYDIGLDFVDYILKFDTIEKAVESFIQFLNDELFKFDDLLDKLNEEPEKYLEQD